MADELYNEIKKDEDVFNLDSKFKTAQSYLDQTGNLRSSAVTTGLLSTGVTTRDGGSASEDVTIAHGLNAAPRKVKITALAGNSDAVVRSHISIGVYVVSSGTIATIWLGANADALSENESTNIIEVYTSRTKAQGQTATISVDATNITLAWTKVGATGFTGGNQGNIIQIMWEAEL